ncbi:adenylate/guanylate cyclase domain-containing protein [Pannonibacter tanglangensis]|uniref:HAMP domain-containing protein n=1 Tax=Pannonibacter tanglangensis TaxID=2750084 RepID=A0ABW9ZE49_9HYPH|nr:adenylate/guanylate cyclase domain-containing protein [Pannonibacter sp. XCT-34]NBN62981.1 HAMP domain-containing protein [Pannonibacter sp. XCT-34]
MSFRLTPTLATVIGLFVLLTAALILFIETRASRAVVTELGSQMVDLGMDAFERRLSAQVEAIREQTQFVARALKGGGFDPADDRALASFAYGALAATPQAYSVQVLRATGTGVEVERGDASGVYPLVTLDAAADPAAADLIALAQITRDPFWLPISHDAARSRTAMTFVVPAWSGERFLGVAAVSVSIARLSVIARELSANGMTVFLLHGLSELLAHPAFEGVPAGVTADNDLVDVASAPDVLLRDLANLPAADPRRFRLGEAHAMFEAADSDGGRHYVVLERTATQIDGLPIIVGAHFPARVLEQPLDRLTLAALLGLGVLMAALVGSAILARGIARPVRRAAEGARAVARLELDGLPPLPDSRIVELKDLAQGFNAMVAGLRAFLRYVPRSLVLRLLESGEAGQPPEERHVAVLFTDIVGFTPVSEGMTAGETAAFLNEHLTLVGAAIDRHGGTIDKYIGDSVMAFWGAPDAIAAPGGQAALAALDIARAIGLDNRRRMAEGLSPVRIRIGLHVGPLVVGDIGAPQRVNYTVIGDTVNVASRLETLGREIDPEAEAIILASAQVAAELPAGCASVPLGSHRVKGKGLPVDVIRLLVSASDRS